MDVSRRIGANTYLVKSLDRSRINKVHNVINLYPYNSREVEEKNFLAGSRVLNLRKSLLEEGISRIRGGTRIAQAGIIQGSIRKIEEVGTMEELERREVEYTDVRGKKRDSLDDKFEEVGVIVEETEEIINREEDEWRSREEKWREKRIIMKKNSEEVSVTVGDMGEVCRRLDG